MPSARLLSLGRLSLQPYHIKKLMSTATEHWSSAAELVEFGVRLSFIAPIGAWHGDGRLCLASWALISLADALASVDVRVCPIRRRLTQNLPLYLQSVSTTSNHVYGKRRTTLLELFCWAHRQIAGLAGRSQAKSIYAARRTSYSARTGSFSHCPLVQPPRRPCYTITTVSLLPATCRHRGR